MKWKEEEEFEGKMLHFCEECGEEAPSMAFENGYAEYLSNYCPQCGAKMFEDDEEI